MPTGEPQTDELIARALSGDSPAMEKLLGQHRARLRQMVAVRMDPRLAARVDPSDVVQEVLLQAVRKLRRYGEQRSLPFYPWLRELAWEHLVQLHRRHVQAQRRSVSREEPPWTGLSNESATNLVDQLAARGTSPSEQLVQEEMRARVRSALGQLPAHEREVLVMRHLEQLQVSEIAAILGITEGAVKMRRMRAFERLRRMLSDNTEENQ